MKKKTFIAILAAVTVACIIFGSIINLTDLFSFRDHSSDKGDSRGNNKEVTLSDIGEFHSIDADIDISSLTITTGDTYKVEWYYKNENAPEASVEDGVLKLTQKSRRSIMNFKNLGGVHDMDLTVTIPEGTELKDIAVKASIAEITLNGLAAKTCSVSADVGDINLTGLKIPALNISSDTGDIDIDTTEFTNLNVDTDIADVDIDTIDDLAAYTRDLKADIGVIEVGGQEVGKQHQAAGSGGKIISVRTDAGEIDIN